MTVAASPSRPFGVHPSVAYAQSIIAGMAARTGRSLDEWAALLSEQGPESPAERKAWLKSVHGLGGTTISLVLDRAAGKDRSEVDSEAYLAIAPKYVEAMFSGPKAALRPIYEALLALGYELGEDVKACPCKTIVPLYRKHVFAEIRPATRTRVDLGLALRDTPAEGRLIDTGGFQKKDRITHRIALTSPAEIDAEVRRWLERAYEMDA